MIKVAIIGAGSVVFSRNMTGDILSYPEFRDAHFCYMDIDKERLDVGVGLCRKIAKSIGATPVIEGTLDLNKALAGADFVINLVQIGGFDSTLLDFDIPRKYGLNFTIADTTGPGGIFRALRTFPMLRNLCQTMEKLCPSAVLLNYSNPMAMNMHTVFRNSNIQAVGLCHSVQGTYEELMAYLDIPAEEGNFTCAGVNHMAFYLNLLHNGKDLYPALFEKMNNPKTFAQNKVRFELMKRLGYFVTESSEHHAEYSPFFIPHGEKMIHDFDIPIDEYLFRCDGIVDEFEARKKEASNDTPLAHKRSKEYGSTIIHSMVTGTPSVVYGNMPNNGAISNLPNEAIIEAPTLVDKNGLNFTTVGQLPTQLLGYMMPHVIQHELFIQAAMEGRRDKVYQACMNDPLTTATLTMDQIVEMCDELIESHGDQLPPLEKTRLVPFSGKKFVPTSAQELRKNWENSNTTPFGRNDLPLKKWQHILTPDSDCLDTVERALVEGGDADGFARNITKAGKDCILHLGTQTQETFLVYELNTDYLPRLGECPRETRLRLFSSTSAKVFANGELLTVSEDIDEKVQSAALNLQKGINRFVIRLKPSDQVSFAMALPKLTY